jgi:hypothetical protein
MMSHSGDEHSLDPWRVPGRALVEALVEVLHARKRKLTGARCGIVSRGSPHE